MASTSAAAKRNRTSQEQLRALVDLLTVNDGLATGKFQRQHGRIEYLRKWRELPEKLNAIGGATKTIEQWQTVWRDLKGRTSNRVRDRNVQRAQTGNRPITLPAPNEMEMRVLNLIGEKYVEGSHDCPDTMEEEEELRLIFEDNDEEAVTPTVECVVAATPSATPDQTLRRGSKRKNKEQEADDDEEAVECGMATTPSAHHSRGSRAFSATPAQTQRRGLKGKRADAEADKTRRFLEIAEVQAQTHRILAENETKRLENEAKLIEMQAKQNEALFAIVKEIGKWSDAFNRLSDRL
ncbi:uncharacterized protein [Eurosta solidaginis]|uniref:uncharacterized protein n=1 Tax=Eurosta solidaginis TaxID=178769 RepID=UPI00353131BE